MELKRPLFSKWIARATNSIGELLMLYAGILLVASTAYAVAESKPFLDALWWSVVTASTVGYGDVYPTTPAGRLIAALLMHVILLFIMPLLIGRIIGACMENKHEFTHEEQEQIKALLTQLVEQKTAAETCRTGS